MLDQLGNLNPQLLRELKGRLNWRSVSAVFAISVVAQILLFLWLYSQLPNPVNYQNSMFCARIQNGELIPNCYDYPNTIPFKSIVINWKLWWQQMAQTFNAGIPFLLIVPGTYFLLSDLQNEERHGTLDFIRLSPRSALSILHGKILGVPILVYGAIASLLPFHLLSILKAGDPLGFFLSFYVMLAAGAYLIFSFSLLFGFFSKSILKRSAQALGVTIAYVVLVAAIYVPGYLIWSTETVWKTLVGLPVLEASDAERTALFWFGIPLSQNAAIAHGFTLLNIAILTGWIWQGLVRCFHRPNATILRKRQSYGLVFYLQVLILGISLDVAYYKGTAVVSEPIGLLWSPVFLNLPIFLALIAILSPQRQAVMDWARYRRMQSPRSSLLKDLLFHDQSPIGLAIVLNLAIAGVLWVVAFFRSSEWDKSEAALMLAVLSLAMIGLYAAIAQWIVIQKTRKRNLIAAVVIGLLMVVPPSLAFLLSSIGLLSRTIEQAVILSSPFLWSFEGDSLMTIGVAAWSALLAQISLIAGIHALMARQVQQIGASEMKAQLAASSR